MKRIWFKTPSFRQFSMYDDGMDGEGAESPKRSSYPPEHMAKRAADNPSPSIPRLMFRRASKVNWHVAAGKGKRRSREDVIRAFMRGFDRYGYYFAAGICALMVFAGALAGLRGYGEMNVAAAPTPSIQAETVTSDVRAQQASAGLEPLASAAPDATQAAPQLPQLDMWPIEGEILTAHATDRLVYLETLNQYGTHTGIDIAATRGQVVVACFDGQVARCWRESMLGNVIEICSANGLTARYANLQSLALVKEGASVKAGDAIGAVGASAMSESLMKPHLHFEVLMDGESVPPQDVLPTE